MVTPVTVVTAERSKGFGGNSGRQTMRFPVAVFPRDSHHERNGIQRERCFSSPDATPVYPAFLIIQIRHAANIVLTTRCPKEIQRFLIAPPSLAPQKSFPVAIVFTDPHDCSGSFYILSETPYYRKTRRS